MGPEAPCLAGETRRAPGDARGAWNHPLRRPLGPPGAAAGPSSPRPTPPHPPPVSRGHLRAEGR